MSLQESRLQISRRQLVLAPTVPVMNLNLNLVLKRESSIRLRIVCQCILAGTTPKDAKRGADWAMSGATVTSRAITNAVKGILLYDKEGGVQDE